MTAKDLNAKDPQKAQLFKAEKTYFEIGVDLDGDMRYGAWQIKETIDLTLPPKQTMQERYLMNFDTDTEDVEVEAKLYYYINGKKGDVVHSVSKKLSYEISE